MKRIALVLLLAVLTAGLPRLLARDDKAEARADDKSGWVSLFNGKDLTGWKLYPNPNPGAIVQVIAREKDSKIVAYDAKLKPAKGEEEGKVVPLWRVEDGILIGSGPHSHLFSERGDYTNFVYRVEAMINDHGNSGQYFRTKFGPDFPLGYEAQINATHGDPVRTGSLYPDARTKLAAHRKEICVMDVAPHKPNEWFTQEVTAIGNHIVIKVNGKVTVDWRDPDNTYTKGHFALQGHDPGTMVKFRKVEVKELPADEKKE
jgi:hypothetical protein